LFRKFNMTTMKNLKIYVTQTLISLAVLSLVFVSCDDDETGMPVITNIRVIEKDSSITAGEFGLPIAIQGRNLGGVTEAYFNDVRARLNPVYVTNTNILLFVTDDGPSEVTNKITLVTASGQIVSTDFEV